MSADTTRSEGSTQDSASPSIVSNDTIALPIPDPVDPRNFYERSNECARSSATAAGVFQRSQLELGGAICIFVGNERRFHGYGIFRYPFSSCVPCKSMMTYDFLQYIYRYMCVRSSTFPGTSLRSYVGTCVVPATAP